MTWTKENISSSSLTKESNVLDSQWVKSNPTSNIFKMTVRVGDADYGDGNLTFCIPFTYTKLSNVSIDWGDGNSQEGEYGTDSNGIDHTYGSAGDYTITIIPLSGGSFLGFDFENSNMYQDRDKLIDISDWGAYEFKNDGAFQTCTKLDISAQNAPKISTDDMGKTFLGCSSLTAIGKGWKLGITSSNATGVTDISNMFQNCYKFNSNEVCKWDVSNVTDMDYTFNNAREFNQDIGAWSTGKVTEFRYFLSGCRNFNQDLSNWNTAEAVYMNDMFSGCEKFRNGGTGKANFGSAIELKSNPLRRDGDKWNLVKCQTTNNMFKDCYEFNSDITNWNTPALLLASSMFHNCTTFRQSVALFNVASLLTAHAMFSGVTLPEAVYNGLLIAWNGQSVQNNVNFGGGNSEATGSGDTARTALINDHSWNITDGGS